MTCLYHATMSTSSSCRKLLWLLAELWAPYCIASLQGAIVHGGGLSTTGMPCFCSFSIMGPAGCKSILVSAKHCCLQHCHAKRTKSPLWSWRRLVFAKLANLPRQSKCCCIARAFFSAVPVGSFSSPRLNFIGGAACGCIPLT